MEGEETTRKNPGNSRLKSKWQRETYTWLWKGTCHRVHSAKDAYALRYELYPYGWQIKGTNMVLFWDDLTLSTVTANQLRLNLEPEVYYPTSPLFPPSTLTEMCWKATNYFTHSLGPLLRIWQQMHEWLTKTNPLSMKPASIGLGGLGVGDGRASWKNERSWVVMGNCNVPRPTSLLFSSPQTLGLEAPKSPTNLSLAWLSSG